MPTAQPGFATQQEAYAALIRQGADPQTATILAAITRPESSGYTAATGYYQGNSYNGLWQIGMGPSYDRQWDISRLRSDDIDYQAAAALDIYRSQGFNAWETYTNGSYQKYLQQYNSPALGDMSGDGSLGALIGSMGAAAASAGVVATGAAPASYKTNVADPAEAEFEKQQRLRNTFLSRGATPADAPAGALDGPGPVARPAAASGPDGPDEPPPNVYDQFIPQA